MEGCPQAHLVEELLRLGLQACEQQANFGYRRQNRALEQSLETLGELQASMRLSVNSAHSCALIGVPGTNRLLWI